MVYRIGKRHGAREVIVEFEEGIQPTMELINEVLGQSKEQREEYLFAVQQMDANGGKIPTRQVYDILYNSYLIEGKIYCPCNDPDNCDVFHRLREYRSIYKNIFTEEELNRKDGL